jgi:alkylated DNA repair dioxygenase AlkB
MPEPVDLVAALEATTGVRFTVFAFQAYRDGTAGCDWHRDASFGAQAIVSLGATRTFGVRCGDEYSYHQLDAGDLVYMPDGFQDDCEHAVIPEPDITGERVSLVFRTKKEP